MGYLVFNQIQIFKERYGKFFYIQGQRGENITPTNSRRGGASSRSKVQHTNRGIHGLQAAIFTLVNSALMAV